MMKGAAKELMDNNTSEDANDGTHHCSSLKSRGHGNTRPGSHSSSPHTIVIEKGERQNILEKSGSCEPLEKVNVNLSIEVRNHSDSKQGVKIHAPSLNPFDSSGAFIVEAEGCSEGSDNDKENDRKSNLDRFRKGYSERHSSLRNGDNTNNHSHSKNGTTKKFLPPSFRSPSCLSVKLETHMPDGPIRSHTCLEDEHSLFCGIAGGRHADEDEMGSPSDVDGYMEESVVVCPFRLFGGCVKGQHTQRELLSNHTILSHLMSLAGLVHELRTEQRVAQKEFQQLQSKVDAQRAIIEGYERFFAHNFPLESPPPLSSSSSARTAQLKKDQQTETNVTAPRYILKNTAAGRNTAVTEREETSTCAQRVCQRTSVGSMTFVERHAAVREPPQTTEIKRLSEEVLTPSHTAIDTSQWPNQSNDTEKGKTKAEGGSPADVRRWKLPRAPFRQASHVEDSVLDGLRSDIVSPITSLSDPHDADLSLCDDEMVFVLRNDVPSSGRACTPPRLSSRLGQRAASSKVFLRSCGDCGHGVARSYGLEKKKVPSGAAAEVPDQSAVRPLLKQSVNSAASNIRTVVPQLGTFIHSSQGDARNEERPEPP